MGIFPFEFVAVCRLDPGCWFESETSCSQSRCQLVQIYTAAFTLTRHLPTDKHHSRENVRVCQTQIPMVTSSSSGAPDRSPGLVS